MDNQSSTDTTPSSVWPIAVARDYDKWLVEADIVEGDDGNWGLLVRELEECVGDESRFHHFEESHRT